MYTADHTRGVSRVQCFAFKNKRRTVREGVDLGALARVTVDTAQAGEGVLAVDVHGT